MKLRQISFKIISMVMVFAMLFSVSATTISAISWEHADHTHENGKDKIHYVSLGDSMANGYCFEGYHQGSSTTANYDFIAGKGVYGTGAYPLQFEAYLENLGYDVEHTKLAPSALLAEDLLYLLGVRETEFDDGWNGYRDYVGDATEEELKEHFQNAIADADIITLGVGNASFGAFLVQKFTEIIGIMGGESEIDENLTLENGLALLESEDAKQIVLDVYAEFDAAFAEFSGEVYDEFHLDAALNLIAYTVASFLVSYEAVVDRIVELNPDVEIILVGLMNTTYGMSITVEGMEPIKFGETMDVMFGMLNSYICGLPVAKQLAGEYAEASFYYAEQPEPKFICQAFDDLAEANWGVIDNGRLDGSIVRSRNITAYNDTLRYAIGAALGFDLPKITLADVQNYTFRSDDKYSITAKFAAEAALYNGSNANELPLVKRYIDKTGDVYLAQAGSKAGEVFKADIEKEISIAIYVAIEEAVVYSVDTMEITLDGLLGIATDIFGALGTMPEGLNPSNNPGPATIKSELVGWFTGSDTGVSMCKIYALFKVGNGMSVHPTPAGHDKIAESVINAYKNGYTAQDKTLGDLITLGNALVDYVKENYDEIYADVYAELVAAGYVDAAVAGVDEAIAAVNAAIAEVMGLDLHANLADSKALLLEELALVADTLADVKNLLTVADQLDAETYAELKALVDTLGQHLDNALALAEELGDVADAQLQVVLADLEALAEDAEAALKTLADEIYNNVNTYLTETLPAEYEAFVDAVTDALRYYSAEAADYVYNWLLENPVTVIEFFAEYGDDAVDFIADNAKAILGALAFVANNYGEKLVGFVLDNAEVILTATVEWFSIHGEHVWELLVVYFDALVEYYNFDFELDFSSFEAIHESFNRVFVLLGDLVDLIAKGVYDFADALNILDEIEAELTNLNAKLSSAVRNQIDAVNGLVEDKIAALNQLFADKIDAINDFVAERIAELEAQAEAQINAVKAEIEAQIAALKAQLETAVGEAKAALEAEIARLEALLEAKVAEINAQVEAQIAALNAQAEAQIAVLEAELKALVEKEIQHAEEAIADLDLLLQNGVKSLATYICDTITNFVEDAVAGKFTPNEDTYYVSVNGGNADYADLLAEALSKNLDNPIALDKMTWGNLDYDKLALADLITIGFDENELSAFAVEQMLGYLEDYLNGDIRDSVVDHADALIAAVVNNLLETYPVYGLILGEYEQNIAQDYADELLNGAFDALVGNGELPEELGVDAETAAVLQWLGSAINGKDAQELDWAKYVGENNLHYVDEAREALRNELTKAGVIETYVLSISLVSADVHEAVVEFLAQIIEESGLVGTSRKNLEQTLEDLRNYDNFVALFGEYATYTIELPVVDSLVFAAESYLYNNVAFQAEYGKLILDLYEINPEATVVLLGHYNPFDFELALGDLAIDLTTAYGCVSGVASLQPFVYALLSEKVAYVDIYELETKYDSYVAEGVVENNLLNFVMMYLADNTITDASEAGNVYIYEQILNYLTIGCEHRYDNACDEICNKCGEHREVAGHVYDHACDTKCNICGEVRETAGHDYADGKVCIHCGHKRPTAAPVEPDPDCLAGNHSFDDCHDRTCYKCDYVREPIAHVYDNCDDASCNVCGKDRKLTGHVYLFACSAECYICGETREPADHVYSGCADVDCNVCGEQRTAGKHTVDDCADNVCNVCGQNVGAKGHQYGDWTETVEATRRQDGEQVRVCTKCDYKDVKVIQALGGLGGGAIAGITVGSVVVAGAAGFAIFWFLIQKKSFAALIEGVKALVGGAAPAAAEAGAAAPAAEAEAPATEEETK